LRQGNLGQGCLSIVVLIRIWL